MVLERLLQRGGLLYAAYAKQGHTLQWPGVAAALNALLGAMRTGFETTSAAIVQRGGLQHHLEAKSANHARITAILRNWGLSIVRNAPCKAWGQRAPFPPASANAPLRASL